MSSFIERLKLIMEERNMNQADLAKLSSIRASSISDWLNGKYEPKQNSVDALAKALKVSPAWLLGYDDDEAIYYTNRDAAEYAEYLRTRPGARTLFSASRDLTKEQMEETIQYIEFLKSKGKKE